MTYRWRPVGLALLVLPALLAVAPAGLAAEVAGCPQGALKSIADWAGIGTAPVVASACKAMPDDPGTIIAVAAFDSHHGQPDQDPDQGIKEQVVALIDNARGTVIAATRDTVEEDSMTHVGAASYRIDTGRYWLASGVRAFGIVFNSDARGPSCPDAGASSELTLYLRQDEQLRPVLGTNTHGWVSVEGTVCGGATGPARSESADLFIAVEKTKNHGFADLSINAMIEEDIRDAAGNYRDGARRRAHTVLHYDGHSYGIDMFRTFWYPAGLK